MENFNIQEELKKLPGKPGVYLMHDEKDAIIYVGKAISLKNRVRQYFQSSRNKGAKIEQMVTHISRFEYIVTEINSYLFYTKKYLVDINPYLLLILIWLQDFVYIVSAELLYLVLKWIFLRGKESVIIVVWLIFLVVERLTGRIIPVVNAATLHMDIVAQMFFIAVLLIGMKLLLLKRVINKRDF